MVLFDAIEDSSFKAIGKTDQSSQLGSLIKSSETNPELKRKIVAKLKDFSVRLVLTAHPTQFYPGSVLSIINDLISAIKENDIHNIHLLLQQLGKTPFINNNKPTPVDEAISLAWFLENVFYKVASEIQTYIDDELGIETEEVRQLIELGFWPGGDRDGNPNVSADSTKKVATLLRTILFRCYYRDFRVVKRRITFRGVEQYMDNLQELFYENSFNPVENPVDETAHIIENLKAIQEVLKEKHNNLFVEIVDDLLRKVMTFGCFFTTLDIRQDSSILTQTFDYIIKKYSKETGISADFGSLSEIDKQEAINFKELDLKFDDEATALEKRYARGDPFAQKYSKIRF